jgi:hypothetical protein
MTIALNLDGTTKLLLASVLFCLVGLTAQAQTSSGQLSITMSVQSSISLIFQDNANVGNPGFCPLTNAGTNNVGLDLGIASHPGNFHSSACVNYQHIAGGAYEVSSAFDVVVSKANSSSPNYRLAAKISTLPPANVAWLVNNVTLNSTGFTTLDNADNYSGAVTKLLQVHVDNSVPAQTLTETITFLATAN